MRSYSSAVMLCWASNCGVTVAGSGTTAEEAAVITVASIVAWESASDEPECGCGKPVVVKRWQRCGPHAGQMLALPVA